MSQLGKAFLGPELAVRSGKPSHDHGKSVLNGKIMGKSQEQMGKSTINGGF